jgi:hypothetical protein
MPGAALITEEDDAPPTLQDIPRPDDGQIVTLPQSQAAQPPAEEYEIIETDADGQPLGGPRQQEAPLSEQAGGPRPLIQPPEPQRQHAPRTREERRNAQRQGRERTMRENELLKERTAQLSGELAEMRQLFSGLEPRLAQIDRARIEDQITANDRLLDVADRTVAAATQRLSEAMASNDSTAFAAALTERDKAADDRRLLNGRKAYLQNSLTIAPAEQGQPRQAAPQQQTQPAPQPLSRVVQRFADDFAERNEWYRPDVRRSDGAIRDMDTRIVLLIDNDLAEEGFDPATPDYWDELEDRARERLPHRFQQAQPTNGNGQRQPAQQRQVQPERRGPMTTGASDRAPTPGRNQVYLSPDRKAALIQAGVLERDGRTVADKAKFNRMMKSYHDYDREYGAARA